MSDTFDPDAWPHTPSTSGSQSKENTDLPRRNDDDDDYDYDPLDVNHDDVRQGGNGYDDDYSSASPAANGGGYDYDYGDAPSPGYGGQYYDDDDDDYDSSTFAGASPSSSPVPTRAVGDRESYGYDKRNDADQDDDYGDFDYGPGARPVRDDYDDGYDSYDDDGDDYDDFADFENDNDQSSNRFRTILIAGVAVIVILLLAVAAMSAFGHKKTPKVASTAVNSSSSTTAANSVAATPPADVTAGLNAALTAWGKFAVDGDIDDVRPYFVNSSDQFQRLQSDAVTLQANPPGGTPLTMQMTNDQTLKNGNNTWVFKGTVVVTRTGTQPQKFPWEITVIRQNAQQPWQIESVRQY
jgi:hypothetical protein